MAHKSRVVPDFLSEAKCDVINNTRESESVRFCVVFVVRAPVRNKCVSHFRYRRHYAPGQEEDIPGIKSNIVRELGPALLKLLAGHHSTWAFPNGCL